MGLNLVQAARANAITEQQGLADRWVQAPPCFSTPIFLHRAAQQHPT